MNSQKRPIVVKHILNVLLILIVFFIEGGLISVLEKLSVFTKDNLLLFLSAAIIIGWLGILFGYYVWAIYFYNINFGLTNQDWSSIRAKVAEAQRRKNLGEQVADSEFEVPSENPYKDETFGLPPGTVRGTIAISLLIGGFALILIAIGSNEISGEDQEFIFSFLEYYKKAFLMMIAFYFGSQSLKYLQTDSFLSRKSSQKDNTPSSPQPSTPPLIGNQPALSTPPSETILPELQPKSDENASVPVKPVSFVSTGSEHVNGPSIGISEEEYKKAAAKLQVEVAVIKAVKTVESSGKGFLADGRVRILFEGHIFWKYLKINGKDPVALRPGNEDIIYPKFDKSHYGKTGSAEYDRFERAKKIDRKAALYSASYGLFQIMGFNHEMAGYSNVEEYYAAMQKSESAQLDSFVNLIIYNKWQEKLRTKNWRSFARSYNGEAFEKNQYDIKLERAYDYFDQQENSSISMHLVRKFHDKDKQTRGELTVLNGNRKIFSCKTLELPDNEHKANVGNIPTGTYSVIKINLKEYPASFQILNVPQHNGIYIKSGNFMEQIRSGILVGDNWLDINNDGFLDVTNSRNTLNALFKLMPDKFNLVINNEPVTGSGPTSSV